MVLKCEYDDFRKSFAYFSKEKRIFIIFHIQFTRTYCLLNKDDQMTCSSKNLNFWLMENIFAWRKWWWNRWNEIQQHEVDDWDDQIRYFIDINHGKNIYIFHIWFWYFYWIILSMQWHEWMNVNMYFNRYLVRVSIIA